MNSATSVQNEFLPTRRRRSHNYWEPIFDPNENGPFPKHNWDFTHTSAPLRVTFTAADLISIGNDKKIKMRFEKISFSKCDFLGVFEVNPRVIVFKNCTFDMCDFGLSTWQNAKFTNCKFVLSSFSQSRWIGCEFRECVWQSIGLSGNDTGFESTTITNPSDFIRAAYTNLDRNTLSKYNINPMYQRMRLENTKATVARTLSREFVNIGEEQAFYSALKTHSNQSSISAIFESYYYMKKNQSLLSIYNFLMLILHSIEYLILNITGFVNAWGRSVARPTLLGGGIIALFTVVYFKCGPCLTKTESFIKAIEITLLIGYTNHSSSTLPVSEHSLVVVNMLLGLLWYVIFIPTLVNRICRIR